ncbi:unnamed protein product [Coregonus sp. 'balchen']|nr:unnamed protein product [Coregonus sp. 'balchen']
MLGDGLAYHVHDYVKDDCRRKWRGLGDRYQIARERRAEKEKKRSGSAASVQRDPLRRLRVTITGAAMEDAGMEEAPLDLGPGEIIMTFTEVTAEDLVEQDVAVETNEERHRERNEEERRHTRRHRRYQPPDPLTSFQQRLLQPVERDAAQPDAHRKEDEETLFAMSLVPTMKRLPRQRKAAVKVKIHQLLFKAEFNGMESN